MAAKTPEAAAVTEAQTAATSPIDVNLDTFSDFQPAAEEHIGYLHSLGLDYGWGPTSIVQWTLEHIHVYSGMPWWGSLMVTSVLIRVCIIPLTIKMSDSQARMATVKPLLDPLQKRMSEGLRNKDQMAVAAAREEMQIIRRRSGFSFKWMGFAMTANMVFAYCSFKLLRAMAALPVPGFYNGGALWFKDLTLADPYYIIPGLMAAGFHLSVRYGAETGGVDPYASQPGMKPLMMYVLPAIIWVSMAWFSAALTLWMATGGLISIAVGRLLINSNMRERLGLYPMPKRAAEPMPTIANFFRDDSAVPAPSSKILDVKGTSKSSSSSSTAATAAAADTASRMTYQAPRVRTSKYSTVSPSNFSDMKDTKPPTAVDVINDAAASEPASESKSGLERYTDWATARVNDMGETYALVGRKVKSAVSKARDMQGNNDEAGVSPTGAKSKEYLRRAKEYEKRYEASKTRSSR